jgi:Nitrile hydratase, alpha chain
MSTGHHQHPGFEKLRKMAARAAGDDAYRERLVNDPAAVLQEEGLTVPSGATVVVHENTENEIHLVLPTQQPEDLDPDETALPALSSAIQF